MLHRITVHPDVDVTFEAECLWCDWAAEPSADSARVDVACLSYTGRSGHKAVALVAVIRRVDELWPKWRRQFCTGAEERQSKPTAPAPTRPERFRALSRRAGTSG
ncbi:hypothetical protein ACFU9X_00230 [Streptomyces atratus]|uniref:hypothetical protein n=1 Tax=Streptomyces atratus TaxID=1893 RepID=UPI0036C95DE7